MSDLEIRRGDIFYIYPASAEGTGSEMIAGRPAIVVSNDRCNQHSPVIEVVYLTTKEKKALPTHIKINAAPRPSIALCEQIDSVSVERVGDYYGTISMDEMLNVDRALAISLGLEDLMNLDFTLEMKIKCLEKYIEVYQRMLSECHETVINSVCKSLVEANCSRFVNMNI